MGKLRALTILKSRLLDTLLYFLLPNLVDCMLKHFWRALRWAECLENAEVHTALGILGPRRTSGQSAPALRAGDLEGRTLHCLHPWDNETANPKPSKPNYVRLEDTLLRMFSSYHLLEL
eukprot:2968579-Amphidinium_carterae.2